MPISLTHNTNNTTTGGTTCAATLTSVSAGARLIVAITKHTTTAATFSVADTVNGAWSATPVVSLVASIRRTEIYEFPSSAAGSPVITVTLSASTDFAVSFYAITGSGSVEDTSTETNTTADPMHAGAATGFNVSSGAFVVGAIAPAAGLGSPVTPDADYTTEIGRYSTTPFGYHAYRITSGSITDERCSLDVTTARSGPGVTASWPEAGAGPSKPVLFHSHYLSQGMR